MAGNVNGYRYPNLSDSANVPNDLQALASDVNRKLARVFSTAAERNAAAAGAVGDRSYTAGDKNAALCIPGTGWVGADSAPRESTAWVVPTLTGGWKAFGGGVDTPAYAKRNGIVWLKGTIAAGTIAQIVFTLPVGFRPNTRLGFDQIANLNIARVDVEASGIVSVQAYSGTGASNSFVSLELFFPVDA